MAKNFTLLFRHFFPFKYALVLDEAIECMVVWQIALQLVRRQALNEFAVAGEVVEPENAKAESVDESSHNLAGSDMKVESETVESSSHEQTAETPVKAVKGQTDNRCQSDVNLKVSYKLLISATMAIVYNFFLF